MQLSSLEQDKQTNMCEKKHRYNMPINVTSQISVNNTNLHMAGRISGPLDLSS